MPARVCATTSSVLTMKPRPFRRDQQQLLAGTERHHRDDVGIVGQIDHKAQRLAMAAAARQLVAGDGVEAAVGGEEQELVQWLRRAA